MYYEIAYLLYAYLMYYMKNRNNKVINTVGNSNVNWNEMICCYGLGILILFSWKEIICKVHTAINSPLARVPTFIIMNSGTCTSNCYRMAAPNLVEKFNWFKLQLTGMISVMCVVFLWFVINYWHYQLVLNCFLCLPTSYTFRTLLRQSVLPRSVHVSVLQPFALIDLFDLIDILINVS